MSRQQLLQLLHAAESSPRLRRRLRQLGGGWQAWLQLARDLGYRVSGHDLNQVHAAEQASRFLADNQLPAIRRLR